MEKYNNDKKNGIDWWFVLAVFFFLILMLLLSVSEISKDSDISPYINDSIHSIRELNKSPE